MNQKKATRTEKKGAKEILRLGLKVFAYRKDIISSHFFQKMFCEVFWEVSK